MAKVTYHKKVSDQHLRIVLQRFAEVYGRDIAVHSGDRHEVVKGSSKKSLHIQCRAADFHVSGLTDGTVYDSLGKHLGEIFDRSEGYEFIRHGPYTNTGGPHLHLGHYPGRNQGKVMFKLEGMTPGSGGTYHVTPHPIPGLGQPIQVVPPTMKPLGAIRHSVGLHGQNDMLDVKTVQTLLNAAQSKLHAAKGKSLQFEPLVVDGVCGNHTKAAIYQFQKQVVGMEFPDTRVDPGGKTIHMLLTLAKTSVPKIQHEAHKQKSLQQHPNVKTLGNLTPDSPSEALAQDPRIQAMLDVLGFTEGTGTNYGKVVNGTVLTSPYFPDLVGKKNVSITDLSRHPHILVQVNSTLKSTAAGRYQFLQGTWEELGMSDFSAQSQDIAAVKLMKRRKMIKPLLEGDLPTAVHKGAPEWASLPKEGGGSYYGGQTAKSYTQIEEKYYEALRAHGG